MAPARSVPRWIGVLALSSVLTPGSSAAKARGQVSGPFDLIVNAGNPVSTLSKTEAGKLFLKKKTQWGSGQPVAPVDQVESAPVRQAFSVRVLGREVYTIKSYWQQLIFAGRDVPPVEKSSDADVIAFVAANPGGIGYVAPSAPLNSTVKVVKIEE
jgi:ABC-type phosphate transport system substrate-binding protein